MPGFIPQRRRSAPGRGLLVASLLVSLVPTALILLLLWQGAIKLPVPGDVTSASEPVKRSRSQWPKPSRPQWPSRRRST